MITNQTVVTCIYDLYVDGENGKEELMEKATIQHPLVYCHGEGMMLPAFEAALEGKSKDEHFDFTIACEDAYGEYDEAGKQTLPRKAFEINGKIDSRFVFEGAVVPLSSADGARFNGTIVEIGDETVTVDLNHPLAGKSLNFVGEVVTTREATNDEVRDALNQITGCGGGCGGCGGGSCDGCGSKGESCGGCQ